MIYHAAAAGHAAAAVAGGRAGDAGVFVYSRWRCRCTAQVPDSAGALPSAGPMIATVPAPPLIVVGMEVEVVVVSMRVGGAEGGHFSQARDHHQ
mmetsp:Transcript_16382/g.27699  ORF Transcript_16382/g.27699 Transcript_16382/m.27699 type:complete len:94 (-) Transcript_16382:1036-1317(-)